MKASVVIFLICLENSLTIANDFEKCGTASVHGGLGIHGSSTRRGQFPFLCALYSLEENQVFCGGTLITTKHVLTGSLLMKNLDVN